VFEEILGIPMHPLVVHAAVIFVPLQVLAALAYALVPFVRRHVAWLVVALAVAAPLAAWLAKLSGDAFRRRLTRNGTAGPSLLPKIDQHSSYGDATLYASAVLGVLMIVLVWVQVSRSRRALGATDAAGSSHPASMVVAAVLTVGVLAMAVATGYYVFRTGDSGAHMVWTGL
jgi:hypothetical protein